MNQPNSNSSRKLLKIPRPRISLIWLLVIMGVLCIGLGWFTNRVNLQKKGVSRFHELRAQSKAFGLYYDYQMKNRKAELPYMRWIVAIVGIDSLCTVEEVNAVLGENAELLNHFPNVKHTGIVHASNDDLRHLAACPDLEVLQLTYPKQSLDWTPIFELKNLDILYVMGGDWDDEIVAKLQKSMPSCNLHFGNKGMEDPFFEKGKIH